MATETPQENPNIVYGRLLESVHISGYSIHRVCSELEWLMDEDRWKQVGPGYEDFNEFVRTVDVSQFKLDQDHRKGLSKRMSDLGASQRPIAHALGVNVATVNRDLAVANATGAPNAEHENDPQFIQSVANATGATAAKPWFQEPDQKVVQQAETAVRREAQKIARANNHRDPPPFPAGTFGVIYADPPWEYDYSLSDSRQIENQYPTLPLRDICSLTDERGNSVQSCMAPDSVLLLWATSPKLAEALQVVDAWGFSYRTCAVWVKDRIGMGYYFRQAHELLLVAARGNLPLPEPSVRQSSVINAPRTGHSSKPEAIYRLIESMYPGIPKIELFARGSREGWANWGNEQTLP